MKKMAFFSWQVRLTGGSSKVDEEERLYRELQGESMGDLIMQKLQEKQVTYTKKAILLCLDS